ncbi:PriCT-2 domain-containing protein [Cupriavidus sp. RAF12]|uniref:PriCT-2 domain-containing protein n=1 Tax=Cupriavidus sp. RAF12 TaxID=3233050 RepID=UPI003F8F5DE9
MIQLNSGTSAAPNSATLPDPDTGYSRAQAAIGTSSHTSTGQPASPAPAAHTRPTSACMRKAKRWLVWRAVPSADPNGKPRKIPYYVRGSTRGETDVPDDWSKLASFEEACSAVASSNGYFAGPAFALGPDETGRHWQGIDLDDIPPDQFQRLASDLPGYVERSPSGNGIHAIGYGRHFATLGSNGTGFEAYSEGRYFTFTGQTLNDGPLVCIADFTEQRIAPAHGVARAGGTAEPGVVHVDPRTVSELRSALLHMRADDYGLWVRMGMALAETGNVGRGLWLDWSATSDKFKAKEAAKKWDSFKPQGTGYRVVFAEAQRQGWVNPASSAAQLEVPSQRGFSFKFAQPGGTILQIEYLIDPWLPRATVVGCYGRGEAGKSSWTAKACAVASTQVSTLWISSEERHDHILQRHMSCGGEKGTLAVIEALPTKVDPATKKAVTTSFNVYEHMEPAILAFQQDPGVRIDRPLGVIVLDAAVALVTWGKGETANDDAGVKRLIARLFALSEQYGVTFIILGHLNKSTGHEHMADAVTGAAAWTNSVRLAYMFTKDMTSENYEGFIRTVKSNTGTHFGAQYRTVPVYTLRQRQDGGNDVLCGAEMISPVVWGEMALREMMADEDDSFVNKVEKKRQKVQAIVERTLQALQTGQTTRKAVEALLGPEKVSRRHWQSADPILVSKYGVQVRNDAHGQHVYWRAG